MEPSWDLNLHLQGVPSRSGFAQGVEIIAEVIHLITQLPGGLSAPLLGDSCLLDPHCAGLHGRAVLCLVVVMAGPPGHIAAPQPQPAGLQE